MRTYSIALREITLKIWRIAVSFTSCVLIILINKKQTNTIKFVIFLNLSSVIDPSSLFYSRKLGEVIKRSQTSLLQIPYLPVYNTRPCIISTPIFNQTFHKKSFHSKKNINASYNWRFTEFHYISNFLSLVITVIRYNHNVYLVSCFLNTTKSIYGLKLKMFDW